MAAYQKAADYVSELEGGKSNNKHDPGGATNYGITLGWYREHVDPRATEEALDRLNHGKAQKLLEVHEWKPRKLHLLQSQVLANKVYALQIHANNRPAIRVLQRAINRVEDESEIPLTGGVVVDGFLGPKTLAAANALTPPERVVWSFERETWLFYERVFKHQGAEYEREFRKGFFRRCFFPNHRKLPFNHITVKKQEWNEERS